MKFKKNKLTLSVLTILALSGCGEGSDSDSSSTGSTSNNSEPELSVKATDSSTEPADGKKTESITVTMDSTTDEVVTVKYDFLDVEAVNGNDYEAVSGTLSIPIGSKSATIDFNLIGDLLDEENETFSLSLSSPVGATINTSKDTLVYTIKDEDGNSEVNFKVVDAVVSENSGLYRAIIRLSTATEKDVSIPFVVSGLATESQDYTIITSSPIAVPAGSKEVEILINLNSDDIPEGGESILLQLESPTNADLGDENILEIVIPGDVGLNDTGNRTWYDGTSFDSESESSEYPKQDAEFGLDTDSDAPDFDGFGGFSYTKLDYSGNALPSNADNYSCVKDNRTGLVWESKQSAQVLPTTNGDTLRDALKVLVEEDPYIYEESHANWRANNYKYYWNNDDNNANGGDSGVKGERFENTKYPISSACAFADHESSSYSSSSNACTTKIYEETANKLSLCGFKDWRLPQIGEIKSTFNYQATDPVFDQVVYFPNTADGDYITATPSANGTGQAWCLDSGNGQVKFCNKSFQSFVRLVRGGSQ